MKIDLGMIIPATINFFIFYLILRKFVFNKTLAVINSRKEEVESAFKKARDEEKRAELLKQKYDEDVVRYRNDGLELVESYKRKADKIYAEVIEDSQREVVNIKERATKEIKREREKANKEIKQEIIDLSMKLAEKTLEKEIDEENHRELIDKFITKVGI
ncbi:F0F1 ATP synthase subunit B [Clostridium sp. UBA1056]|uniref:F0F1 ATP synthase subunit B n=1 Tax=unclassified Clostridium TaxID=2614128 RepID=UPI003217BC3F